MTTLKIKESLDQMNKQSEEKQKERSIMHILTKKITHTMYDNVMISSKLLETTHLREMVAKDLASRIDDYQTIFTNIFCTITLNTVKNSTDTTKYLRKHKISSVFAQYR